LQRKKLSNNKSKFFNTFKKPLRYFRKGFFFKTHAMMNNSKNLFFLILTLSVFSSCQEEAPKTESEKMKIDFQGHRGCRGLLPENTTEAFIKAVDLGVTTVELDVVISKDLQVVVSHDPYLSDIICKDLNGEEFDETTAKEKYNIFQMNYEEIAQYDCGSKFHPRFPDQELKTIQKPLLKNALEAVEKHIEDNHLELVNYNIEIKSTVEGDHVFHPEVAVFADLLVAVLKELKLENRTIIQSFDVRALQYMKEKHPEFQLAFLVENEMSIDQNLDLLGFIPSIYSPYYLNTTESDIKYLHEKGMKVIPWTINELEKIQEFVNWGADGIISDYPNLFKEVKNKPL
jgi:glycerophosphoryl diester phosphodiesterase